MAVNIGPKIGIDGESEFKASLRSITQQAKELESEMKAVTTAFTSETGAQQRASATAEVLTKQIANQRERVSLLDKAYQNNKNKLDTLRQALTEATSRYGANSTEVAKAATAYDKQVEATSRAKTALNNAQAALNKMGAQLEQTTAKTGETEKATESFGAAMLEAGQKSSLFGEMLKANLLGDAIKSGISAAANAVKGIGSAFLGAAKESLSGYGDYEQLVGGVQTLFNQTDLSLPDFAAQARKTVQEVLPEWGKLTAGARIVQNNAEQAWKTAGLSANDYMETATASAAAMVNSLGGDTAEAAKLTDVAITDMADNVNKMGSSMDSVQDAYSGFAKQNYTMLDNLKIGYGGTKEEMQRLLSDANKLNAAQGKYTNYTIDSYADIVRAIHDVQTEMGITGTTAKEASSTILGSISSAKAAWKNFLIGVADSDADIISLGENLAESLGTVADNVLPRVEQIVPTLITGIGKIAGKLAPIGKTIAKSLGNMLQSAFEAIGPAAKELVPVLAVAITAALPELLPVALNIVQGLQSGIMAAAPQLMQGGMEMLQKIGQGLASAIPAFLADALPIINEFNAQFRTDAGQLIDAGIVLIENIAQGIANSLPTLIKNIPEIVSNIAGIINDNAPKLLICGANVILTLLQGLWDTLPTLLLNLPQILLAIADVITAFNWLQIGGKIITLLKDGMVAVKNTVTNGMKGIMTDSINYIKSLPEQFKTWGRHMIEGMAKGITDSIDSIKRAVGNVVAAITSRLHFSRPDIGPLHYYEQWMPDFMRGLASGIDANIWRVEDAMKRLTGKMGLQLSMAQTGSTTVNQNINFGYEVQAPDVVAAEVRKTTEYGLAGE